ncbi:hypothetical protein BC936DRAFT_145222 [Jimgerdemannia flammicorona]|uniref:S1-like domain-containing protein n=1 Tax=Jimgerdemannia flammicorona TaxID=994334 RepID=A0A433DP02_9FUNG|nr:hypothetical protein BC936DRAFT_145222 [Jimgerdemannia flammicorona]
MGRKQTAKQAIDTVPVPIPPQEIARVVGPRGKNLHEIGFADGRTTLVTLPPKFRNLIWVKRGNYVIVDPTVATTDKIGGEIVHPLMPAHIKQLKADGVWYTLTDRRSDSLRPPEFAEQDRQKEAPQSQAEEGESYEEDSDDDLFVNNNRPVQEDTESEEGTDDDEE